MKQATNHFFPFQVWLQTIAMATFLLLLGMYVAEGGGVDLRGFVLGIPMALYIFCLSVVLSLPALAFFWLLFLLIKNLNIGVWAKKLILAVAGILLIALTFHTLNVAFFSDGGWVPELLPSAYAAALAINTGFVRMYETTQTLPDLEPADKLQ